MATDRSPSETRNIVTSTGGAIGLSAIASFIGLCCIGPWSVALLGVTGAVAMARYAFLKPYIILVAAMMLGWAFWRVYFRMPECADGACPSKRSWWLQGALWFALVLVILAFFAEELQWIVVDPTPEALR